jgi:hypothetical protein
VDALADSARPERFLDALSCSYRAVVANISENKARNIASAIRIRNWTESCCRGHHHQGRPMSDQPHGR